MSAAGPPALAMQQAAQETEIACFKKTAVKLPLRLYRHRLAFAHDLSPTTIMLNAYLHGTNVADTFVVQTVILITGYANRWPGLATPFIGGIFGRSQNQKAATSPQANVRSELYLALATDKCKQT